MAVLNAATVALGHGDATMAAALYERVVNTPPAANEGDAANTVTAFAHFRAMVALLADSREEQARTHLEALAAANPSAPLARLAAQLYDQYGMTAQLRGACAQLRPQIDSQAGPTLAMLRALGVDIDAQTLCSVPQI